MRYAQTFLGMVWTVLQPIVTLIIFTLIFGRALNVDTGEVPYTVYALSGMCAWAYFSFVMSQSGNSIIGAGEMVKKIYFPRLVIPLSKSLVAVVDFLVTLGILLIMMIYHQTPMSVNLLFLPLLFILTVIASLGVGIWLSALTIRYRDFQHVVPFMVQIGLYATPIAYPTSMIPEKYQLLYHLNPMTGIISGFRWSILGQGDFHQMTYVSYAVIFVLFFSSIWYFKRMERTMADLV